MQKPDQSTLPSSLHIQVTTRTVEKYHLRAQGYSVQNGIFAVQHDNKYHVTLFAVDNIEKILVQPVMPEEEKAEEEAFVKRYGDKQTRDTSTLLAELPVIPEALAMKLGAANIHTVEDFTSFTEMDLKKKVDLSFLDQVHLSQVVTDFRISLKKEEE